MTRQIMTMNKITKCHVNETGESAGWFNYEAGTAYEAGTLVFDSVSNAFGVQLFLLKQLTLTHHLKHLISGLLFQCLFHKGVKACF